MFNPKPITIKKPGDPILADDFNRLVERLVRLENIQVSAPLSINNLPTNPLLSIKNIALFKRMVLTAPLIRGENTTAKNIYLAPDNNFYTEDIEQLVGDPFNILTGNVDDLILCMLPQDNNTIWEIIRVQHIANWIYFRTKETFNMTDEFINVDVIEYWDGYSPETTAANSESSSSGDGSVRVYNLKHRPADSSIYEFHGSDNLVGYANYDTYRKHYRLIQLQCG